MLSSTLTLLSPSSQGTVYKTSAGEVSVFDTYDCCPTRSPTNSKVSDKGDGTQICCASDETATRAGTTADNRKCCPNDKVYTDSMGIEQCCDNGEVTQDAMKCCVPPLQPAG